MQIEKALYGLKQACRAYFNKLSMSLKELGFANSKVDPFYVLFS